MMMSKFHGRVKTERAVAVACSAWFGLCAFLQSHHLVRRDRFTLHIVSVVNRPDRRDVVAFS
jgi:hypothetical protein